MTDCTIINADSREWLEKKPFAPGEIKCVVTDPPYGVDFQSRRAVTPEGKAFVKDVANDGDLATAVGLFNHVMDELLPMTADEAELYVFTRWDILDTWMSTVKALSRHGFQYKMLLIWDKGIPGMGDIDCNWGCGHEEILYLKKGRREVPERRSGIIHVDKLGSKQHIHPTEKPVGLLEKLIEMSTDKGDLVVDPFSGSGSAIVAAQRLGRRGVGIELEPVYAAAAEARLGQTALQF